MATSAPVTELQRRQGLDGPADFLLDRVGRPLAKGPFGDFLTGRWLGHPLHPALTDLPIGFRTSAVTLDFLAPRSGKRAAQLFVGLGTLTAVPTVMAGLADASSIDDRGTRRVAAAHALGNGVATVMFALSWRARRHGHGARGVLWSLLGTGVATGAGYLGGHLAFGDASAETQET
jgi:uncharacterized membrane protein